MYKKYTYIFLKCIKKKYRYNFFKVKSNLKIYARVSFVTTNNI